MDLSQIIVTVSGIALSGFVIWFFFFSSKKSVYAESNGSLQEINIKVKGGYDPDVIVVKENKPLRLNFYREETSDCSEKVLFPDFKTSAVLPPFKKVQVDLMPDKKGEFTFTCGMGMLRGKLIVQ